MWDEIKPTIKLLNLWFCHWNNLYRTDDVISQACSYRGLGIYLAFSDTQLAKIHFEKNIEIFKSVDESEE